ncbi:hypothetical protein BB560_001397 [Smittium megazygosporum]|uniref:Uncharacterized protein n=1 Tax=Smittium megazygosporum TaxID=133381 RepID=A0A2T9ZHN8_9FUNG|nr:hypothetical protein BB560_001397 [Smittium megazygosporum]
MNYPKRQKPNNCSTISNSPLLDHPLQKKSIPFGDSAAGTSFLYPYAKRSISKLNSISAAIPNYDSINEYIDFQTTPDKKTSKRLGKTKIPSFRPLNSLPFLKQSTSSTPLPIDPWNDQSVTIATGSVLQTEVFKDDDFGVFNPHWDDMITFRELKSKVPHKKKWSISHTLNNHDTVNNSVLFDFSRNVSSPTYRFFHLIVLPVTLVIMWVSVPLPSIREQSFWDFQTYKINFWAFLFFYYGVYNICALLLVTNLFQLYSLNWWPESMSATSACVISWLGSICLGAILYLFNIELVKIPLVWTGLTLCTLVLPVVISFIQIRRRHLISINRSLMKPRKKPSSRNKNTALLPFAEDPGSEQAIFLSSVEWINSSSSYLRYLWFCAIFPLWYIALVAGEYLALSFLDTLPHKNIEGLKYVYTWIAVVNSLDLLASWVISSKIRSWPLQYCYQIYFTLTYFIFYRNLFARLHSPSQYLYIQLGSSLWIVLFYPFRMLKRTWKVLKYFDLAPETYDEYLKRLGSTFYIRNFSENATMLAFIMWVTVLHFGPNKYLYPYFQFSVADEPADLNKAGNGLLSTRSSGIKNEVQYSFGLTIKASLVVWCCELIVSRMIRAISRFAFKMDIPKVNYMSMLRYPYMVPVIILLVIHVLQNMLFALIHLDFY